MRCLSDRHDCTGFEVVGSGGSGGDGDSGDRDWMGGLVARCKHSMVLLFLLSRPELSLVPADELYQI
jgi:hypothetical protein